MSAEIVTTLFLAHPAEAEEAYRMWERRVREAPVAVHAVSPAPHPIDAPYALWDLRTEAAYGNLAAPEEMQLFEANALVDVAGTDRDEVMDTFFIDDPLTPSRFPSQIGGLSGLLTRDPVPAGADLSLVTVVYLGAEGAGERAQELFAHLLARCTAVAYEEETALVDVSENAELVGPLWIRDATLNLIGRGDGLFSPAKDAWSGWFLTPNTLDEVEGRLVEQFDPGTVIIARAIAEPF